MKPHPILAALAVVCGWHLSTATTLAELTQLQTLDHVAGMDMQVASTLAINSSTGRLYVGGGLNSGSNSEAFKLIDTKTNLVLPDPTDYTAFRFGADDDTQIAVDAAAGRYYILADYDRQLGIVDAATDTLLSTVDLSTTGTASLQNLAVNTTTHTVYITQGAYANASGRTGSVIVVDGLTGATLGTVAVNSFPSNLVVDETLNRVYVATADYNAGSTAPAELDVIDGASRTVVATVPLSSTLASPSQIAVNPQTHRVYASVITSTNGSTDAQIAVIDGGTGTVLARVDSGTPYLPALAVDPSTNRFFVGDQYTGRPSVVVFDGASNARLGAILVNHDGGAFGDLSLNALLDDPATGRVYTLSYTQVNVIDANTLTRLPDVEIPLCDSIDETGAGGIPVQQKSAVDPGLNRLYTVNDVDGSLTVIDLAAGQTIHNVPLPAEETLVPPGCVDVNTATHQVYVSSPREGVVVVIDGQSGLQTAAIALDGEPRELAVDSTRNLVYVSTTAGLAIIDGASGTVVNTLSSVVSRQFFIGDGSVYYDHAAVAVNPVTNRVYVTGYGRDANSEPQLELDVIDGASATVIDRLMPAPGAGAAVSGTLAVNTVTNKIYLVGGVPPSSNGNYNFGLYEIDGATDAATAIAPPSDGQGSNVSFDGAALAVNTALNRVYIAYYAGETFSKAFYYDVATGQFTDFGSVNRTAVLTFDNVHDRLYQTDSFQGDGYTYVFDDQPYVTPSFFTGQAALSNGVYYLAFSNGNYFGYYSYLSDPHYIYHFDLGYEYVFDAADGHDGVYFYDFASSTFFYTAPTFPFPYLYDFSLNSVLYYYPDPNSSGHYNTNGVRYFYEFANGQIISK